MFASLRLWVIIGIASGVLGAIALAPLHFAKDVSIRAFIADSAYKAGRAAMKAEADARTDSVLMAMAQRATDLRRAKTDTVWRTVERRITEVETLTVGLPDSIRQRFPVVDSLARSCSALANDCSEFRARVEQEREAAQQERQVANTQRTALAMANVGLGQRVTVLEGRPTQAACNVRAGAVGLIGALGGYVWGNNK